MIVLVSVLPLILFAFFHLGQGFIIPCIMSHLLSSNLAIHADPQLRMGNKAAKPEILNPSGAIISSIFDFTVPSISGSDISLETFRGKSAYLVVNVASQ